MKKNIALNALSQVITLVTFGLAAYLMPAVELGGFAVLTATSAILTIFYGLSLENSMLKKGLKEEETRQQISLIVSCFLYAAPLMFIVLFIYGQEHYVYLYFLTSCMLVKKLFNCLSIVNENIEKIYEMNIAYCATPSFSLGFYYVFRDFELFLILHLLAYVVISIYYGSHSLNRAGLKNVKVSSPIDIFRFVRAESDYVVFNSLSNILQSISTNLMTVIFGGLYGEQYAASYALANKGLITPAALVSSVMTHKLQASFRAKELPKGWLKNNLFYSILFSIVFLASACVYILIVHQIIFQDKYPGFNMIAFSLIPLFLSIVLYSPVTGLLTILRKNRLIFASKIIILVSVGLGIVLNISFWQLSLIVGITSFLSGLFLFIACIKYVRKK